MKAPLFLTLKLMVPLKNLKLDMWSNIHSITLRFLLWQGPSGVVQINNLPSIVSKGGKHFTSDWKYWTTANTIWEAMMGGEKGKLREVRRIFGAILNSFIYLLTKNNVCNSLEFIPRIKMMCHRVFIFSLYKFKPSPVM